MQGSHDAAPRGSARRTAPRRRHFRANPAGRDFVVGDLHGCRELLLALLKHVGFDTRVDRLFSVGDLVDRGPDSLGCLRLLDDACFHAVRGNHEQMMLDWLASQDDGGHWFANGGAWVLEHWKDDSARAEIEAFGRRLAALPLMVTVELADGSRFNVVHAEFPAGAVQWEADLADPARVGRLLDATTRWGDRAVLWGRDLLEPAAFEALDAATLARLKSRPDAISGKPGDSPRARLYGGHTVLRSPLRIGPLTGVDTGAFLVQRGRDAWAGLTLTEPLTDRFWTANAEGVREVSVVRV